MKRLLLSGIAALFLATGAAHAAEIPKQYHGWWCPTEWKTIYERCHKEDELVAFIIGRTWWGLDDEGCTLTAISKSKYGGHRLSGKCARTDPSPGDLEGHTEERGGSAATIRDCKS